jgi:hypothetical protein
VIDRSEPDVGRDARHVPGQVLASASAVVPQRRPDFFIVGHPKCGTTALFEMLSQHPQIFMPDIKETWFFVPELRSPTRRKSSRPETLEEYLTAFAAAGPEQRAGEATPAYLRSHTAARRIAEVCPDARIIAILREPAAFLRSLHLQFVQTHVETEKDFRKAIELEEDRRHGLHIPVRSPQPKGLLYSDIIRYAEQLRRFHDVFPPEQVLVLIYDDFRRDNEETVRTVLRFLGVDDKRPVEVKEANPTVRVRSVRFYQAVQSISIGHGPGSRAVKAGIKRLTSRGMRHGALRLARQRLAYAEPGSPDEKFTLELRARFKDEVVAISEYLDRDLVTLWGYDDVG